MDRRELAETMIVYHVMRGDIASAREYATDYALLRDAQLTVDELLTSVDAYLEVARAR